jgi:hypothetical protein
MLYQVLSSVVSIIIISMNIKVRWSVLNNRCCLHSVIKQPTNAKLGVSGRWTINPKDSTWTYTWITCRIKCRKCHKYMFKWPELKPVSTVWGLDGTSSGFKHPSRNRFVFTKHKSEISIQSLSRDITILILQNTSELDFYYLYTNVNNSHLNYNYIESFCTLPVCLCGLCL